MKIRNLTIAAATVGAIAMSGGPASAAPNDQVTGSGTVPFFDEATGDLGAGSLSVSAHVAPAESSLDATGNVRFDLPGFENVHGDVTCLAVFADGRARIQGELDEPVGDLRYFSILIIDNGAPGTSTDEAGATLSAEPFTCRERSNRSEVTQGNFTIQDR